MRWRFIVGIGLVLTLAGGRTAGSLPPSPPDQDTPTVKGETTAREPVTPLILRVILLAPSPPLLSDPTVQKILAFERTEREKAHRKPGSFVLRLPGTTGKAPIPAPHAPKAPTAASPKTKEAPPGENVSAAQLQTITDALLADALAEHLHKLKIAVVSETEVGNALETLRMTLAQASRPEGAEKLRAQLNGDAVLTLSPARIQVMERQNRTFALWVTVRVPALRTPRHAFPPLAAPVGTPTEKEPRTPLTEFAASGAATTGHTFLKSVFARTPSSLAQSAAEEAAAIALHALRTGSAPAFPVEDAQIALMPVAAPTQADQLLFAPEGRKLLPGAVRGLPADVSERFRPDLLPLFPQSIRDPGVTQQALQTLHLTSEALWDREQTPNRDRIQALGHRLKVGYVLLAHITNIEVDSGISTHRNEPTIASSSQQRPETARSEANTRPLSPPAGLRLTPIPVPPWERQGRAEAVGILMRVRDGVVLWQDRATATMSSRQVVTGEEQLQAANRQIAEDATRFALLQLQRQFRTYRREAAR